MKQETTSNGRQHQTLGSNVRPTKYTLDFTPNLRTFRYSARESIHVSISRKTRQIALNSKELAIKSAVVASGGKAQEAVIRYDEKLERVILSFGKPIKGEADIAMEFTGVHNDQMYGFYRSAHRSRGKTRYLLSSQFEAANARNAFPCFDEPEFKAVFSVSLTVGKDLHCISNMPIAKTTKLPGRMKTVQFQQTPPMSTYLLYLGVGNYDYAHGRAGRIKVRVVTTPGNGRLARLPLKYAISSIRFYERYFGIKYPLPKIDFLAIPDFAAGAMENWGAITFREAELLIDENSPVVVKQRVAEVIAHELTHQWFGDLVTMKWWNDLWLNESFATFMSYKAMDAIFPEWNSRVDYLTDVIAVAFGADQLKSTHPVSVHVDSPAQIDSIFDEISYEKGGTVLNMIEDYAGPEVFRKGLHSYLKSNSYSNATKFDLWRAIENASGRGAKVQKVASHWIEKPGYPIIEAKRIKAGFMLSQRRFFLLGGEHDSSTWPIPITYSLSGNVGRMLMERKKSAIRAPRNSWLKLNLGQNGLYRAAYDEGDTERLGELIRDGRIGGVDAWGIEQDLFSRSRSGLVDASGYLNFVDRYCLDAEYPLSSNVLGHLGWIHDMLYYSSNARSRDLLIKFSSRMLDRLGWDRKSTESVFDTRMRASSIMESGMAGYGQAIARCRYMFYSFINDGAAIEANIKGAIYNVSVWSGGESELRIMRERFEKETVPEEKNRLLRAISLPSDPRLIRQSLDYSMSDKVRLQDAYAIPAIVSSTPVGRKLILDWTMQNWQELKKRYVSGTHMLHRYAANMGVLSSAEDKDTVSEFFTRKENYREDIKQALGKALEQIEANRRFMDASAHPG